MLVGSYPYLEEHMEFTDKEYDMLITKRVDKIVFHSGDKPVFTVDFNKLISTKLESDPNLKKQLLQLVLKSDE